MEVPSTLENPSAATFLTISSTVHLDDLGLHSPHRLRLPPSSPADGCAWVREGSSSPMESMDHVTSTFATAGTPHNLYVFNHCAALDPIVIAISLGRECHVRHLPQSRVGALLAAV